MTLFLILIRCFLFFSLSLFLFFKSLFFPHSHLVVDGFFIFFVWFQICRNEATKIKSESLKPLYMLSRWNTLFSFFLMCCCCYCCLYLDFSRVRLVVFYLRGTRYISCMNIFLSKINYFMAAYIYYYFFIYNR